MSKGKRPTAQEVKAWIESLPAVSPEPNVMVGGREGVPVPPKKIRTDEKPARFDGVSNADNPHEAELSFFG